MQEPRSLFILSSMIIGHLALASVAKQTLFRKENGLLLVVSSIMPDLLDKPASMFLGLPGRGAGHSLIVLAISVAAVWFACTRLRLGSNFLLPAVVMWLCHIAGDFVQPEVLFWPFLGHLSPGPHFDFAEKIHEFYFVQMYPEQFWLEIAIVFAALGLWVFKSGFPRLLPADRND